MKIQRVFFLLIPQQCDHFFLFEFNKVVYWLWDVTGFCFGVCEYQVITVQTMLLFCSKLRLPVFFLSLLICSRAYFLKKTVFCLHEVTGPGLLSQPSGWHSSLPVQGAQVQSLIRELKRQKNTRLMILGFYPAVFSPRLGMWNSRWREQNKIYFCFIF